MSRMSVKRKACRLRTLRDQGCCTNLHAYRHRSEIHYLSAVGSHSRMTIDYNSGSDEISQSPKDHHNTISNLSLSPLLRHPRLSIPSLPSTPEPLHDRPPPCLPVPWQLIQPTPMTFLLPILLSPSIQILARFVIKRRQHLQRRRVMRNNNQYIRTIVECLHFIDAGAR